MRYKKLKCGAQVRFENGVFYLIPEIHEHIGRATTGAFYIRIDATGLLEVLELAKKWAEKENSDA